MPEQNTWPKEVLIELSVPTQASILDQEDSLWAAK